MRTQNTVGVFLGLALPFAVAVAESSGPPVATSYVRVPFHAVTGTSVWLGERIIAGDEEHEVPWSISWTVGNAVAELLPNDELRCRLPVLSRREVDFRAGCKELGDLSGLGEITRIFETRDGRLFAFWSGSQYLDSSGVLYELVDGGWIVRERSARAWWPYLEISSSGTPTLRGPGSRLANGMRALAYDTRGHLISTNEAGQVHFTKDGRTEALPVGREGYPGNDGAWLRVSYDARGWDSEVVIYRVGHEGISVAWVDLATGELRRAVSLPHPTADKRQKWAEIVRFANGRVLAVSTVALGAGATPRSFLYSEFDSGKVGSVEVRSTVASR